eukprot:jgi/Orpsp1_1/1177349/evm.model.c7180000061101.1
MKPKKIKMTLPVCLFCVVDVSGSMGLNCCNNMKGMERIKITRLELIKHSLKTIVSALRKEDKICVIEFSNNVKMIVEPVELSNKDIKDEVINKINDMKTSGMTNMWAGINMAIENSKSIPYQNYQKSIMVFTDGESNSDPPEGVYKALENKLNDNDDQFTISTFSYGNDINLKLLVDIAKLGNGIYGYCPDATMVGTIFINYMANLLSTITPVVKISLMQNNNTAETKIIGPLYRGTYRNIIFKIEKKKLNKIKVVVELPIINQTFNVPLSTETVDLQKYIDDMSQLIEKKEKQEEESNNNKDNSDSDDELLDEESDNEETVVKIEDINTNILIEEKDLEPVKYEEMLLNQISRYKLISSINKIINLNDASCNEAKKILDKYFGSLNKLEYKSKFIKGLIIDISNPDPNHGQIEKAIDEKYYLKWGKCYLSSILRFHEFEQCGNFKDQSLQYYSHEVFDVYRKMANTLFLNLPPPKATKLNDNDYDNNYNYNAGRNYTRPTVKRSKGKRRSFSFFQFFLGNKGKNSACCDGAMECRVSEDLADPCCGNSNISSNSDDLHIQMNKFLDRRGGCFNGNAVVLLANGRTKYVKDLKKGDRLSNNAIVQCLIEQNSGSNSLKPPMCDINGVLFTPYHPIFVKNKWYFPVDLVKSKPVEIDSWFNLILNDDINHKYEIEFENGIKAITLGHHRKENSILEHPYFGSDLVLKDLKERDPEGYSNGYIYIKEYNYHQLQYDHNNY